MKNAMCFLKRLTSSLKNMQFLWGVLLVAFFTLIPIDSYAATTTVDVPTNNSSTISGYSDHGIFGGCLFSTYTLQGGDSVYLGQLFDGVHNCGYRVLNNALSYYQESVGHARSEFSNGALTDNIFSRYSNNNILNTWDSTAITNHGRNVRDTLHNVTMSYFSGSNVGAFSFPAISNGYAIVGHRWHGLGVAGTMPIIDRNGNTDLSLNYLDGHTTTLQEYHAFLDFIDNHTYMSCTTTAPTNITPDSFSNFWRAYDPDDCYIISYIPLSSSYTITGSQISYIPAQGSSYRWQSSTGETLDTFGLYDFLQYTDTYFNAGSFTNDLKPFPINDMAQYCDSDSECLLWGQLAGVVNDLRDNSLTTYSQGSNSVDIGDNIYTNWFEIFTFGFSFPFSGLFSSFTDGQSCVAIPIIGGMLNNPNAIYCSWWDSNVRDVLTPVFSLVSIMIIFGFIMHWLRSDGSSIKVKGGKT